MVRKATPIILDVARVIGLLISLFPGTEYGPFHYRVLEHDETNALAANAGDLNMGYRALVAQLVEHRAVTREVVSSTPTGPSLRVLK